MVDCFMAYNFNIWWVGAYRGMGGYWNEYMYGTAKTQSPKFLPIHANLIMDKYSAEHQSIRPHKINK